MSAAQPSAETVKYYCLQRRMRNAGQSPLLLKKKIRTETVFQITAADDTEQEAMRGNSQDVTLSGP